jgi:hypothetical protein
MQGNSTTSGIVSSDSQAFPTQLNWDGAAPHDHGYYLNDASYQGLGIATQDLGYHLLRGVPLQYNYRIANVTNVPLTYTSVAELSGPTFGASVVSQYHTVTVPAYSLSSFITGTFTPPSSGASAFFNVKLFAVGSASVVQDVKFLRLNVQNSLTPTVTIAQPANGAHVYVGSDVVFSGSGFDLDDGNKLPDWDLSWSANSTGMGGGASITHQFSATGTYTITLKGTNAAGATGSASISITVDPAPPNAVVTIVAPTSGEYINVNSNVTSAQVELVASGSPGMQFSWSDSIDGAQGSGADVFATLTVQNEGNCAPVTTHTITLTGTDNLNRTKTAHVTFYLRPTCIT